MKFPEGSVIWLSAEGRRFPHYVFSGDTDQGMQPMVSLTSASGDELFLVELLPGESDSDAVSRVGDKLGRSDARAVRLLRVGSMAFPGQPFLDYQSRYKNQKPIYSALDDTGEATKVGEESADSFVANGGFIHVVVV
jgi:hypothetical protein